MSARLPARRRRKVVREWRCGPDGGVQRRVSPGGQWESHSRENTPSAVLAILKHCLHAPAQPAAAQQAQRLAARSGRAQEVFKRRVTKMFLGKKEADRRRELLEMFASTEMIRKQLDIREPEHQWFDRIYDMTIRLKRPEAKAFIKACMETAFRRMQALFPPAPVLSQEAQEFLEYPHSALKLHHHPKSRDIEQLTVRHYGEVYHPIVRQMADLMDYFFHRLVERCMINSLSRPHNRDLYNEFVAKWMEQWLIPYRIAHMNQIRNNEEKLAEEKNRPAARQELSDAIQQILRREQPKAIREFYALSQALGPQGLDRESWYRGQRKYSEASAPCRSDIAYYPCWADAIIERKIAEGVLHPRADDYQNWARIVSQADLRNWRQDMPKLLRAHPPR